MKRLVTSIAALFVLVVFATNAFAQQQDRNPLLRLLQSKGIITEQEAAMVSEASSAAQAERRLSELLRAKGVISREEFEQMNTALGAGSTSSSSLATLTTAGAHLTNTPAATSVTPAPSPKPAQAQPQGEVTTTSKIPLKLYGSILFNANYVDHGANTIDIPLFPQKHGTSADQDHQNFNMTLRETRFGLRYEGKIFDDAKLTGVFEFDLLGGSPAFANGINFDIFRVRLAYGRVDWKNDSLEAG